MQTVTLNNQTYPVKIAPPEPPGNPDLNQLEDMPREYNWIETFDEDHNSIWMLVSPYEERFKFRLKQRIRHNEVEWEEAHDAELYGRNWSDSWYDLNEAKAAIEQCYRNILADNSV